MDAQLLILNFWHKGRCKMTFKKFLALAIALVIAISSFVLAVMQLNSGSPYFIFFVWGFIIPVLYLLIQYYKYQDEKEEIRRKERQMSDKEMVEALGKILSAKVIISACESIKKEK